MLPLYDSAQFIWPLSRDIPVKVGSHFLWSKKLFILGDETLFWYTDT